MNVTTALSVSPDMVPNITLVSELFDSGNKKKRALSGEDNQRDAVVGMGMSAMFIGSEHSLLLDESVLKVFDKEFISKLARRCWFNFPEMDYKEEQVNSIDELLNSSEAQEDFKLANILDIGEMAQNVAQMLSNNDINKLVLDKDADRLYKIYKFHCKYESEEISGEAQQLEMLHRHWKVLKLAGVYATIDERVYITTQDITEAISFAEMINGHLDKFIKLSKREHYEVLIDLLRTEHKLSVHELKKRDIISGKSKPETQVKALVEFGNSKLGKEGMLKFADGFIELEIFEEVEHGASYKMVSGSKEERAWQCKDGYEYKKSTFEKLGRLLSNDTSYCAFKYRDGIRSNDNIDSSATFVVLDVDDSDIAWTEAHDMLQDFNHHVAQTSDANNPYKFRVIIELDIAVDLDSRLWKNFMAKVGEYLGLELDLLPKSQIYFGYKDREVLSTLDADALPASELVKGIDYEPKQVKKLPASKISSIYDNRFETFEYAYEYSGNWGGATNYRMAKHAYDLGADIDTIFKLIDDVCDYRDIDTTEFYKRTTLDKQVERMFHV